MSGTSASTPLVAAAAALIKSQADKVFSPDDLKAELQRGVDQVPGLEDWSEFGGRLNAARPLLTPRPPDLGAGGTGGGWQSCDPAHDGLRGPTHPSATANGPYHDCPDSNGAGVA